MIIMSFDLRNYLNYFNIGYTYSRIGNYKKAMESYQEALRCNPFHASSHLHLGLLCARQNQLTRALLSLETFLLIEPSSGRSNQKLVFLENLCKNYVDTIFGEYLEPVFDNDLLADVDHLIASRLVLKNAFPLAIDFDIALVKQTDMVLKKIPFDTNVADFWVEMYFPFYKQVRDQNFIAPLLYTLLRSTKTEKVNDWNEKNEKLVNSFFDLGSELTHIKY